MSDHTSGPWIVDVSDHNGGTYIRQQSQGRRSLAVASVHRRGAEKQANANLLAAAPDFKQGMAYYIVYAATLGAHVDEEMLAWCKRTLEGEKRTGHRIAEDAISRAEGRS